MPKKTPEENFLQAHQDLRAVELCANFGLGPQIFPVNSGLVLPLDVARRYPKVAWWFVGPFLSVRVYLSFGHGARACILRGQALKQRHDTPHPVIESKNSMSRASRAHVLGLSIRFSHKMPTFRVSLRFTFLQFQNLTE